ncbi:carboxypeptidase regulatory-like domain-containing protein [Pseudoxanthomonas sp. PXM01]|uniref:carboxypeptidase regulatory-like domain-containing protein n=1 Tax=Pseudoxanthomonas sp. PXM01 TaxID=2769295 RepID=UPI00177E3F00|nr:carboxypeptidase regulatory-like domain-containing protein [Pseudoxanthomonas sp. PXM01]MBD9470701.1 carboxypeptidase regulatory-like domain-containing protein [Pseudoxanthomonas sp. PXM01]
MTLTAALPSLLAGLLALAVVMAWVRLALWRGRAPHDRRGSPVRFALLCLLQPVVAGLLYFTLLPPRQAATTGTLVVMTAQADRVALPADLQGQPRVALPEAPAMADAERVPDLGTALRRHPEIHRIHVVGAGLEARDRDAVGDRGLAFSPTPLPRGLVQLSPVATATPGAPFDVSGRVQGVPSATVVLRDPAGQRIAASVPDAQGGFRVTGLARLPGPAVFRLEVLDAARSVVDTATVPVWTQADAPPRVWALAGAPNAEWKYLRRWATDAGVPLHLQVSLGGGLQLGDAPLPMTADTLRRFDLVLLDARSAAALGDGQRAALAAAVRDGLGVLVRTDGALSPAVQRMLGLSLAGNDEAEFHLPRPAPDDDAWRARRGAGTTDTPVDADAVPAGLPTLSRRALRTASTDAIPLLRDADGTAVAWRRAEGRGRIGAWTPTDTYALVLAGHPDAHAALWSQAVGMLARTTAEASHSLADDARVAQRVVLCDLADEARVTAPDGDVTRLQRDSASGAAQCAGFWPRAAGWHQLGIGETTAPFHVRAADDAPTLHAMAVREQTQQLASRRPTGAATSTKEGTRWPAWPWFLGFLAAAGLLWWLERRRPAAG